MELKRSALSPRDHHCRDPSAAASCSSPSSSSRRSWRWAGSRCPRFSAPEARSPTSGSRRSPWARPSPASSPAWCICAPTTPPTRGGAPWSRSTTSRPRAPSRSPATRSSPARWAIRSRPSSAAGTRCRSSTTTPTPASPPGTTADSRVVLRSVGHGPNGATVTIEVQVSGAGLQAAGRPCPGYAQRGIDADGSGRNDCLGTVDHSKVQTYAP